MKYENILSKNKKKNMTITKKREVTKSNPILKRKNIFRNSFIFPDKLNKILKINIFLYMLLHIIAIKANPQRKLESYYSYITITINGKGNQNFLSSSFSLCADEVYVNDIKIQGEVCKTHILNETTNSIKIVFLNEIYSTSYMFYRLYNIKAIDLSHFNSSLVNNMRYMFSYCYNLASIDFTNINTF